MDTWHKDYTGSYSLPLLFGKLLRFQWLPSPILSSQILCQYNHNFTLTSTYKMPDRAHQKKYLKPWDQGLDSDKYSTVKN